MSGVDFTFTHPSAAETKPNGVVEFDTTFIEAAAIDIVVTALTGGTSPSITFFVERQMDTSSWSQVWTSGAITTTPTSIPLDLGPHSMTYAAGTVTAQHAIFTRRARLRWAFGGSVAPTSVTFEASVVTRSQA